MKEMPRSLHYGSATFDGEFQSARRDDGLEVRFTRSESRLLHHMVRNAGRVLSRNQLLDAVSEPGSDKSDRNIDFAINRLRRKLNDSPQDPKFIATRYGEGYIWVAKAASTRPPATAAHVVLGPFHGVNHIGAFKSLATGFGHTFHMRIAKHFGPSRKVVLDPECPPRTSFEDDCPEIAVDFTFLADEDGLECVFHATAFRTGRLLCVVRHRIAEAEGALDDRLTTADALADRIASEIWKSLAVQPETHEPLPLSMHIASVSLTGELPIDLRQVVVCRAIALMGGKALLEDLDRRVVVASRRMHHREVVVGLRQRRVIEDQALIQLPRLGGAPQLGQ